MVIRQLGPFELNLYNMEIKNTFLSGWKLKSSFKFLSSGNDILFQAANLQNKLLRNTSHL